MTGPVRVVHDSSKVAKPAPFSAHDRMFTMLPLVGAEYVCPDDGARLLSMSGRGAFCPRCNTIFPLPQGGP